jgi:predicted nucleotidyltransferase
MTNQEISSVVREKIRTNNPEQEWVWDKMLFLHLGGSRLYGTHTQTSDWDVRGVTLAPKQFWVGARSFEHMEFKIAELHMDVVIYDFRKWLHLTVNCNPNVVEALFVDYNDSILESTPLWFKLARDIKRLLSRRAHAGYHGYATSQLKKMMVKQANKTGRRELAEAHGFDTKFAMHAFRLAAQGEELLLTGNMTFPRPDAEHLRAIRDGKVYGPDEAQRCIDDWEKAAARLDAAVEKSVLPPKLDFDAYDALLVDLYDQFVHDPWGTPPIPPRW